MKIQITNANTGEVEVRDMTASEEEKQTIDVENATVAKEARKVAEDARLATKASAKAKLIAGEALTEAEADTIVL
jgi:hypothetical protein